MSAGLLLGAPASALAAETHVLSTSFGSAGSGDGQLELAEHSGIAVNETSHDVYVADTGNHRVDQFSSSGTFIRAFGADVGGAGVDICISGCAAGTSGSTPGAFEAPTFVAIDNSASASNGDVYVADTSNNLVTKFEADGTLVASWGVGGQLDGSTATEGPFTEIAGIAVDSAGNLDVFVVEPHIVFQFDESGAFLTEIGTPRGSLRAGLAVDAAGSFFKVNGAPSVEKVEASGTDLGQVSASESSTGLAVDTSNGQLYVDTGSSIDNYAFEPSGEVVGTGCTPAEFAGCPPTASFGSGDLSAGAGLAVDGSSHAVYAADVAAARIAVFAFVILPDAITEAATEVTATEATLNGALSAAGGPEATCEFQYTTEEAFGAEGFEGALTAPCVPAGPFTGSGSEAVSAEVEGLAPGTNYRFRLVASNENGSNLAAAEAFTSPPAVNLETGEASPVGATSATLNGMINPEGIELDTCEFEYGETEIYSQTVPCTESSAEIGTGTEMVAVHAGILGLNVGTEYHFRLVATNEFGTSSGADRSFQTLGPAISASAASQVTATGARISALVNPNGEATSFAVEYVTDAQFQESGYTNATSAPIPPKEIGSGSEFVEVTQQLTNLTPGTAYHFRVVVANSITNEGPDKTFTTFAQSPAILPDGRAYEMVSPPEKSGEVFPPEPALNLGSSCPIECLPGVLRPSAPMQSSPDGEAVVYEGQPFTAGLAGAANEYLGERTPGGWGTAGLSSPLFESSENQGYKAFSADLSRGVVYQIEPALSEEAPTREGKSFANLYLREDGVLRPLVTEEPPQRSPGRIGENRFNIVYSGANAGSGISAAFSHLLFAANDALTEATPFAPEAPEIETNQKFCQVGQNCNLYEWNEGQLRLVNVLPGNTTTAPGSVIGSRVSNEEPPAVDHAISDDGSRIFWSDGSNQLFVRVNGEETEEINDPGRFLTASTDGSKALLGDGCLYDLEEEACEDLSEGEGGFQGILGASSDLSQIYFVDTAALSEEENANGEEAEEGEFNLYGWDEGEISFIGTLLEGDNPFFIGAWKPSSSRRTAQVSSEGRYLTLMSRAPLTGYDNNLSGGGQCLRHSETSACFEVFEYDAASATLTCASCNPSGQRPIGESNLSLIKELVAIAAAPFPAPHNLTTDGQGRLFFESQDTLSPRDTNGHIQDVYEWEPNGVGSCERPGGCVFLISSGHAANDSMFFNSTPSGNDAFLVTREQLLPRDKDEQLDLYDARVGGGFPEGETPPCNGETCPDPIASPPAQASAGSPDAAGPGNATPKPTCKPGFVRKHGKCVKKKHHKHHKRSAKRNRGANR